jgi:hypothetical protein
MFWLMLGAAVVKGVGGIISRAQERSNAQAEIDQKLKELNLETAQATASLENQKSSDKVQAEQSATQLALDTRSNQLAGEADLASTRAQGAQAAGNQTAQNAANGIEGRTTVQDVLDYNIQDTINQKRESLDLATAGATTQLNQLHQTFQAGSAYMNIYASKKSNILTTSAQQESFLQERRKSYDYNANWFAQDLFGVAGVAADFASKGASNNWWAKAKPAASASAFVSPKNQRLAGGH